MAVGVPRTALFAVVPVELLILASILSGSLTPTPAETVAAALVAPFTVWEALIGHSLFTQARAAGAGRRAALRTAATALVPVQLRMILHTESKSLAGLAMWARRERDVAPGATALPYAAEQRPVGLIILFVMAVETVTVELLMAGAQVPPGLRAAVLAADLYGLLFILALGASCTTRPHTVTATDLRIRYGAYLDVRVPRALIASVRIRRDYPTGLITVTGDQLTVAVSSQTNMVITLKSPITARRPLGGQAQVTTIRFFTEDPATALKQLTP